MALTVETEEVFVLLLVLAGYVPVVRAYAAGSGTGLLLAGYTALLVGRVATIAEDVMLSGVLPVVEHGVGVALAGLLFLAHFYSVATNADGADGTDGAGPDERTETGTTRSRSTET